MKRITESKHVYPFIDKIVKFTPESDYYGNRSESNVLQNGIVFAISRSD